MTWAERSLGFVKGILPQVNQIGDKNEQYKFLMSKYPFGEKHRYPYRVYRKLARKITLTKRSVKPFDVSVCDGVVKCDFCKNITDNMEFCTFCYQFRKDLM